MITNLCQLDLNLLLVFHVLYQERSASLAAARMALSQPALSHKLNKLRHELGDALAALEAARANGDLVKARKGNAKYRLAFHGKAAHAGTSLRDGISAITELAHWTLAINGLVNFDTGTTLNVGMVQGGTGVNVVPDFAEAIVDLRFWNNDEADAIHARLEAMAASPFVPGCRIEVERQTYKPAMRPTAGTEALMRVVEEAAASEGIAFGWQEAGGGDVASLKEVDLSPLDGPQAQALMLLLAKYPEMLTAAAQGNAPHDVTFYLRELASAYHSYYDAERILVDDEAVKLARLALVAATAQVLANGLAMLGVSAPQRM